MYAVIETGGKQYRVSPGDVIDVERVAGAGQAQEQARREGEELQHGSQSTSKISAGCVPGVLTGPAACVTFRRPRV